MRTMNVIPQKELRNNVSEVLRRAEAGEEFTVTVAGRPVARLGPARPRQWVRGPALQEVWRTPAPRTLADDLVDFPAELRDPFTGT
jgi:prevent-host-death family protein